MKFEQRIDELLYQLREEEVAFSTTIGLIRQAIVDCFHGPLDDAYYYTLDGKEIPLAFGLSKVMTFKMFEKSSPYEAQRSITINFEYKKIFGFKYFLSGTIKASVESEPRARHSIWHVERRKLRKLDSITDKLIDVINERGR